MTKHTQIPAREPLAAIRSLAGGLHTIRKTCSALSRRAEAGDEDAQDRHQQIQSKLIGDLARIDREIGQVEAASRDLAIAADILRGGGPGPSPADGQYAKLAREAVQTKCASLDRIAERLSLASVAGQNQSQAARKRVAEAKTALDETLALLDLQTVIAARGFNVDHPSVHTAKATYRAALDARKAQRKSA